MERGASECPGADPNHVIKTGAKKKARTSGGESGRAALALYNTLVNLQEKRSYKRDQTEGVSFLTKGREKNAIEHTGKPQPTISKRGSGKKDAFLIKWGEIEGSPPTKSGVAGSKYCRRFVCACRKPGGQEAYRPSAYWGNKKNHLSTELITKDGLKKE